MGFVSGPWTAIPRDRGSARGSAVWRCATRVGDVVVVGGGGVGLSTALEIAERGGRVTVVGHSPHASATLAAAGMIAPQAERLEEGPLLSLCLRSRAMYPSFVEKLVRKTAVEVPFRNCGRFIGPELMDSDRSAGPIEAAGQSTWYDADGLRTLEPSIGDAVVGGWVYSGDASVDNRALFSALLKACEMSGVRFVDAEVTGISLEDGGRRVEKIQLADGSGISADHYVVTAGAWTRKLLALPVKPIKGQMLRLKPPTGASKNADALSSVLFGEHVYVVPRSDGSIVVGATVEDVGFQPGITAGGIQSLLAEAMRLVPALGQYEIAETWWGYRPTTPDLMPIIGTTQFNNCSVATGHHRNGILLLPITGEIVANIACSGAQKDIATEELAQKFSWQRFSAQPPAAKSRINGVMSPPGSQLQSKPAVARPNSTMGSAEFDAETLVPGFSEADEAKKWKDEIMVWKVGEDGSEIAVRYKESVPAFQVGYGHTREEEEESVTAPSTNQPPPVAKPQEVDEPVPVAGSQKQNVSNDAYDDILVLRENAQQASSEALKKNRMFGVNSSKGLCLSDEEYEILERAREAGLEDAKAFAKRFRDGDAKEDFSFF